jgi:hypothetical protein
MRYLLAFIALLPALAQEPAAKPEEKAATEKAAAPAAEAKPAESPVPSAEQWLSGSVDFGYRWVTSIGGSSDTYRSVVNLGEGPKLTGSDFTIQDPKRRLFDRIDVRTLGWGGDPYNTAHANARKAGVYDFRFDYRNIAYYNSLSSFANPLLPSNLLSDHRFDTHRRMTSFDLDLLPGKRIVPFFSYQRDGGRGRGVTTFVTEGNDYAVPDTLSDHTDNYRGGLRFEFNRWHVTLEQGAANYNNEQAIYNAQQTLGDRTSLVGSQTLSLSNVAQAYAITADSIYSKLLFTASPVSWLNVTGQFLYSQPKSDVRYTDNATGNLVVLSTLLFYNGQSDLASGTAKAPHTSGSIGFELHPLKRLRIVESLTTDRLHNAAYGLLTETMLLGTASTTLTAAALADKLVLNYNRQQVDAIFDLTPKITVRGGYRFVWGDATVRSGTLSQTGTLESSELRQHVGLAGLTLRPLQKMSVNVDYEGASSGQTYFRSSLHDFQKARMRARYQAFGTLTLQASAGVFSNQNPDTGIQYDFLSRDTSLSAFWTPGGGKRISVTADYTRSTLRSDITYKVPQQLSVSERSFYRDNSHTATAVADVALPGYAGMTPKLSAGGSLFVSAGSRPSSYYQPLARLSLPVQKHVYWNSEWRWYGFGEQAYVFEGFRAHVFMTGLRLVR